MATHILQFGPDPSHPPDDGTRGEGVMRGRSMAVTYYLDRWGERARRDSVTDICLYVRFHPQTDPVVDHLKRDYGSANVYHSKEFIIPRQCERIEMWFRGVWRSPGGDVGDSWDSRYGINYWFETIEAEYSGGGVF